MKFMPMVTIHFTCQCRITFDGTEPTNKIGHYINWPLHLKLEQAQKIKIHRITKTKKRKAKKQ